MWRLLIALIAGGCLTKPLPPIDQAPACAGVGFANLVPLTGLELAGRSLADPTLDNGGTELYFTFSATPADYDIGQVGRATANGAFDINLSSVVDAINSSNNDDDASLSGDGLDLVVISSRNGSSHVWESQRATRSAHFSSIGEIVLVGDPLVAYGVDLSADGKTLYYIDANYALYQVTRPMRDQAFGPPSEPIATEISWISVSPDQLEVFYVPKVGLGVYRRTRTDPAAIFDVATEERINSTDEDPDISSDSTLLVMKTQVGSFEVMHRECP